MSQPPKPEPRKVPNYSPDSRTMIVPVLKWHISNEEGTSSEEVTIKELIIRIEKGQVHEETLIWEEKSQTWKPAREIEMFRDYFSKHRPQSDDT